MACKNKHCSLDDRIIICNGIVNGATKKSIADTIGKDPSTVGKEIKLHRRHSKPCSYTRDCVLFPHCPNKKRCSSGCSDYVPFVCKRRDRSPGACNGCSSFRTCRYDKYIYDPEDAQDNYRETLIDSRSGVDLTVSQALEIGKIIKPLLDQKQSPYIIIQNHPELAISEKTLYNYIENGVLKCAGITSLDLRRQVSRRITKRQSAKYKKRKDRAYLKGAPTRTTRNIFLSHREQR
ncbi:hypothetical protein [Faecalicoccus acidiformans]|uniref:hypothetical protein n=1 Tax=Faecalicoccus acidiformans TaxID=915173 RepID=UPI001EF3E9D4|nr:hypothetical protein [Faecalicoccus acidiformans]